MTLNEPDRPDAMPPYPDAGEDPPVRIGTGAVMVATRCPSGGTVELEVWAGDPESEPSWGLAYEGEIETIANGFVVGDFGDAYQIAAAPGRYRVRAYGRRDEQGELEAVRFVFPNNPELTGFVPAVGST
jgi:hypothetical protein